MNPARTVMLVLGGVSSGTSRYAQAETSPRRQQTRIYLVRHGETDWNRESRLQGAIDVPLNEAGTAQAHQLAAYLAMLPLDCVISSPLARAWATAMIVADACGSPLRADQRLREVDHGSWSGLTLPEIAGRFPSLVANEHLRPEAFEISGGERLTDVHCRVSAALADVLAQHDGQSVAVVGHGVALALMLCAATGVDPMRFNEHALPNASVVLLTFSQSQLLGARVEAPAAMTIKSRVRR